MSNDLTLFGTGLDQPIPSENDAAIMEQIEDAIQRTIDQKNPDIALNVCKQLITVVKVSGKALARILHKLYQYWEDFGIDDDFWDTVYLRVGLHRHTVERYVRVGAMLSEHVVPQDVLPKLEQRNMAEIIPIANALAEGYQITESQWEDLVNEPDANSVRQRLLTLKGEEPRKAGLRIYLDSHGTLWAETVETGRLFIGALEITDKNPVVERAINRIIDHSGVIR